MPNDHDALTEPDDDLSDAARQLGDQFLADEAGGEDQTAAKPSESATDVPGGSFDQTRYSFAPESFTQIPDRTGRTLFAVPDDIRFDLDRASAGLTFDREPSPQPIAPELTFSLDSPSSSGDHVVDEVVEWYFSQAAASVGRRDPDTDDWVTFAGLVGRTRPQTDPSLPAPEWDRLFPELLTHLRDDQLGPAGWADSLGIDFDTDLQLVIRPQPLILMPPSEEPFDWDALGGDTQVQFDLFAPVGVGDDGDPDVSSPLEEQRWHPIATANFSGDPGDASRSGAWAADPDSTQTIELPGGEPPLRSDPYSEHWQTFDLATRGLEDALADSPYLVTQRRGTGRIPVAEPTETAELDPTASAGTSDGAPGPDSLDAVTEPEDDLSAAARQLGDQFLSEEAVPDDPESPSTRPVSGLPAAGAGDWYFHHAFATLSGRVPRGSEWTDLGALVGRSRPQADPDQAAPDWDRLLPELVSYLRDDRSGSAAWWAALAAETDVDFRLVIEQEPLTAIPPSEERFDWDALAGDTQVQFELVVPDDGDGKDSGEEQNWRTIGTVNYLGDPGTASGPLAGVTRTFELPGGQAPFGSDEFWEELYEAQQGLTEAIRAALARSGTPGAEQRPPSSPLEAIDRELAAEAAAAADLETPAAPPDQSVLDYVDQDSEPPTENAREPDVEPPDRSALDFVDRPHPRSPFQAIDRELEAEREAEQQTERRGGIPIWVWPAVAVAILAIGGFFAFGGGGDDDPEAGVPAGVGTVSAPTATAPAAATSIAPAATATAAPTATPRPQPTPGIAQIPTLIICPDGSSFSGYEQPDGTLIDAETNEPRVCPPPPN